MSDRRPDDVPNPNDDGGPGSDPGTAYDRAIEEGQVEPPGEPEDEDEGRRPSVGDVYRSGS